MLLGFINLHVSIDQGKTCPISISTTQSSKKQNKFYSIPTLYIKCIKYQINYCLLVFPIMYHVHTWHETRMKKIYTKIADTFKCQVSGPVTRQKREKVFNVQLSKRRADCEMSIVNLYIFHFPYSIPWFLPISQRSRLDNNKVKDKHKNNVDNKQKYVRYNTEDRMEKDNLKCVYSVQYYHYYLWH